MQTTKKLFLRKTLKNIFCAEIVPCQPQTPAQTPNTKTPFLSENLFWQKNKLEKNKLGEGDFVPRGQVRQKCLGIEDWDFQFFDNNSYPRGATCGENFFFRHSNQKVCFLSKTEARETLVLCQQNVALISCRLFLLSGCSRCSTKSGM